MASNRFTGSLLLSLAAALLLTWSPTFADLPPVIMGQPNGEFEFPFPPPDTVRGLHCELITYDFDYFDDDSGVGPVIFSLTPGSPGSIDTDGVYSYTPSTADIGQTLFFTVRVCRPTNNCTQATVRLLVDNDPPIITNACGSITTASIGSPTAIPLAAEDNCPADPRALFLVSDGGMDGAVQVNPVTEVLTVTPAASDLGIHNIIVGATDGMDTSFCTMQISVPGQNAITLDAVTGLQGGAMVGGTIAELQLRIKIDPAIASYLTGYSNGFRVYSPDGAVWDTAYQAYLAPWPTGTPNGFDNTALPKYGLDGSGDDTLAFGGFVFFSDRGALPGYDEVAWSISIRPSQTLLNDGRTICLDTVMHFPPSNQWLWNDSTITSFYPTWDGPHCFTIVSEGCCEGLTGNVSYDAGNVVNLSDLSALVNHLFVTFQPPACRSEANTSGDSNCVLSLTDLSALVNYLFVTFTPPASCDDFDEASCY